MWKRILLWTSEALWKFGRFSPSLHNVGIWMMLRTLGQTHYNIQSVAEPVQSLQTTRSDVVFIDNDALNDLGEIELPVNHGHTHLDVN